MTFHILGPVEVRRDGAPLPLGGRKQRTILAVLLLNRARTVSTETLMSLLWGDDPPRSVQAQLHNLVSRIRRAAGPSGRIHRRYDGYQLDADDADLDLARFDAYTALGRAALADRQPRRAADAFQLALGQWGGPALHGVTEQLADRERHRLEERRLAVLADRFEAELELGAVERLIPELTGTVRAWPFHDRFRGQLMRALHGSGRRAEALACYADGDARYRQELGISLGHDLAQLHGRILRA
ncbi:DNA-binding SARP family transcriptional activator [Allocatelliglobosispora scoriae]|uniref:DNA-binding SARP family transcriptional activator n=1 Tax=Allocatelliglobosispora scoriae TaxID=643052 RepID=A0A841BL83_9ACTN|nr:AfsR/SARP family transcriptional regulator [Allocatelliglobosispora scoriae]MBB5868385.1 DNA-binding SARP family transcriptional activator [Allocatelliglobosispora scoriae]